MGFVSLDTQLYALNSINKSKRVNQVAIDLNVGRSVALGWKRLE